MTTEISDPRSTTARPFDATRRAITKRVTASAAVPTFTVTAAVNVDPLLTMREQFNSQLGSAGRKLSVNDFIVHASAAALREHPGINSSYSEENRGQHLQHERVNIGIAVDSPHGLVVPVIRDADTLSLTGINTATRDFVSRANEKQLRLEDVSAGTFSISNLGMFGIESFTALIIPPQGAILAVGSAIRACADDPAGPRIMRLTLTADHRVIDGALAARFMATLSTLLANPTH